MAPKITVTTIGPYHFLALSQKIFEKCLHERLNTYFDKCKILSNQYGLKKKKNSTQMQFENFSIKWLKY